MCLKLQLDHQLIKEEVHTGSFLAIDEGRKDANSIRFMQIIKGRTFANKQKYHTQNSQIVYVSSSIYTIFYKSKLAIVDLWNIHYFCSLILTYYMDMFMTKIKIEIFLT